MSETVIGAERRLAPSSRPDRPGLGLARHLGPALMIAVGYVDPGNWATGIAAGSAFGMELLSVVLLASLAGMLLQVLAAKLGVATGRNLAQACREAYGPRTVRRCGWGVRPRSALATWRNWWAQRLH